MKEGEATSNVIRLALATILAHALVVAVHSAAHQILGVQASPTQLLFIVTVIIIAPPLACILLWKGPNVSGAVLLACSMAGALVFGVYNHFVAISPDHISHVSRMSPTSWSIIFQATALLLAITEGFGIYAGLAILKRSRSK